MTHAPIKRLTALTRLLPADVVTLEGACKRRRIITRNRPVCGQEVNTKPIMLLNGWAGRVRLDVNGNHQLLGLILPGDIVQTANEHYPPIALTDVAVADLPPFQSQSALDAALSRSRELELGYLYNQVSRIGGMNANARLLDVVREIFERLLLSGSSAGYSFDLPLSQTLIADLLAITPVHANRMIKEARLSGELSWLKRRVTIRKGGLLDQEARSNLAELDAAIRLAEPS